MSVEGASGGSAQGLPTGGVFRAALDAVVVMSADGRVRDWNPAAERTFGYSREEAVGRDLAAMIIPEGLRVRHRSALRRYLATGRPTILDQRLELVAIRADGGEFPVELTVTRVPGVEPPLFAGFVRDLTAAMEAAANRARLERRLAFLAEAGSVLDQSLELGETLERLAALTVPVLADLCLIDVRHEDGVIRCAAAAAARSDWADAVREIRDLFPLDPAGPHPVAEVLRTGRAVLLPEMPSSYLAKIAQGSEHLKLMERLRYRSAVVTPLTARGRGLGALSVLRMEGSDLYGRDELTLTEELARRAAIAVDNARLYEATRHIAVTLQASLLPRSLPSSGGLHYVARYRAASDAQQVGGDFYDAFPIDERTHALVIGDVCGKGAEAAALTALARYTIRGAAMQDRSPPNVMAAVNEAVHREQGAAGRFLTAIYATAERTDDTLEVEVASGGHPPPLVARAHGGVESVPAEGTLLGVEHQLDLTTVHVTLERGDTLVLYTDGLTDAGAPGRILTDGDIARILSRHAERNPEALADLLEQTALSLGPPRDDIALLLLHLTDTPTPTLDENPGERNGTGDP